MSLTYVSTALLLLLVIVAKESYKCYIFHQIDHKRRRPGATDGVHCPGPCAEQPKLKPGSGGDKHARARRLLWGRAHVMVPPPPFHGQTPGFLSHLHVHRVHRSIRPGSQTSEIHNRSLSLQIRQREADTHLQVLLLQLEDLGRRQHPAGLAALH